MSTVDINKMESAKEKEGTLVKFTWKYVSNSPNKDQFKPSWARSAWTNPRGQTLRPKAYNPEKTVSKIFDSNSPLDYFSENDSLI